jgi:hypothetical protein
MNIIKSYYQSEYSLYRQELFIAKELRKMYDNKELYKKEIKDFNEVLNEQESKMTKITINYTSIMNQSKKIVIPKAFVESLSYNLLKCNNITEPLLMEIYFSIKDNEWSIFIKYVYQIKKYYTKLNNNILMKYVGEMKCVNINKNHMNNIKNMLINWSINYKIIYINSKNIHNNNIFSGKKKMTSITNDEPFINYMIKTCTCSIHKFLCYNEMFIDIIKDSIVDFTKIFNNNIAEYIKNIKKYTINNLKKYDIYIHHRNLVAENIPLLN